ncbi:Mur ligase family protein [Herbidospora cretacea]|uniref:Mur ligase family protein n=1 Tax=Herbidospora cretacea TaxID=28444 RepID=UPI000773E09A|nr:Mur ligase family protein [Herbidospora cretacea]
MSSDEAFFAEWTTRRPGSRRDLPRARRLAQALGAVSPAPVLTVVGSKGKGTTATYASAYLASTGARVVTVTSPGLRSNRDRIRVDGVSISDEELAALGARVSSVTLPASDGYLSPAGLFTIAGILHAQDVAADFVVLEAGMGGASDEVSLFPAEVVAVTEIFAEHLGILGDTVAEIAREKAGVITEATRSVVTLPQSPEVRAELSARAGTRLHQITPQATPWTTNALLGRSAAAHLTSAEPQEQTLRSVRLPARFSHHDIGRTRLIIDSPITGAGVAMSVQRALVEWGSIDRVLLCLPDHKDLSGAITELGDLPVTFVQLPETHLNFTRELPPSWDVTTIDKVDARFIESAGDRVLALGTIYFTGHLLDNLNIPTDRLFEA